ncbi:hypothetical protein [Acaryochloris sp. CCMEE 5410]|uniref:hypothetical protein n=1 Tax=Acaryochloris sp. CCMEE 5410 TaxID=310037 RepID=UPI001112A0CF|nr:hypothetical protein [Acaryochloris sp. CCMEE 5410]
MKERAVFGRQIDAYAFAAAYAMKNNLDISDIKMIDRSDLEEVSTLDDEVRLALEASLHSLQKRNGQPEPGDSQQLMDLISRYAEVGLASLQTQWTGKTSIQIQDKIRSEIS